ncbi:hypothetical protein GALL_446030 [mine drainage metagenome]|uniref:Uncharacterized protein n=1 Tax=mine drainage metagenome TaxID=410659 RepID=A0A1J5QCR0_9ZZZZ
MDALLDNDGKGTHSVAENLAEFMAYNHMDAKRFNQHAAI